MRHRYILTWIVVALISVACGAPTSFNGLRNGEAQIHYLGHAGWLVRTAEHSLVFDYTGAIDDGDLARGKLSPDVLAGQRVVLFISHAHSDHFKRHVLALRDTVPDLTVVMGWDDPESGAVVVPADGQWTEVSGAEVFVLHHTFDGIPEAFFLVRSGGVVVYHSGDHGTWSDPPNETYRTNIERLAAATGQIDLAFISSFGDRTTRIGLNAGDVLALKTLTPNVAFPMHGGGREEIYRIFADEASALGLRTENGVAGEPGARFDYRDGALH